QQLAELPRQYPGRLEPPVLQVLGVRTIDRTRDMPGDTIERLDLATETFRRTRIDQHSAIRQVLLHALGVEQARAVEPRGVIGRRNGRHAGVDRAALRGPCF